MDEKAIEAMKARNAELEAQVTTDATTISGLNKDIETKDSIIKQKSSDVIGARKKYKTLKEMSDEEKSTLSEDEIVTKEATDEVVERQEATEKQQATDRKADIDSRRKSAVDRFSNGDQEVADKINANFDLLRGSDGAYSEDEIGGFVNTAVSMMGQDAPNPIQQANNSQGGEAGGGPKAKESYADTASGKELSGMLGLSTEEAK